jgi:hypothetical protein
LEAVRLILTACDKLASQRIPGTISIFRHLIADCHGIFKENIFCHRLTIMDSTFIVMVDASCHLQILLSTVGHFSNQIAAEIIKVSHVSGRPFS